MNKEQALRAAYRLADNQGAELGENLFCRGPGGERDAPEWSLVFQAPDCPQGWNWLIQVRDDSRPALVVAVKSGTPPQRMTAQPHCPKCGRPVNPGQDFCRECNAPLSLMAAAGGYESVLTGGYIYHQATSEPEMPIVVFGLWLIVGPILLACTMGLLFTSYLLVTEPKPAAAFVTSIVCAGGVLIFGRMLYKSTSNYFRLRSEQRAAGESVAAHADSPMSDNAANLIDEDAFPMWPFPEPEKFATATARQVVEDGELIKYVTHAQDGTWEFLPASPIAEADERLVELGQIVALDPTVCDLADLPPGWEASRRSIRDPWVRWPAVRSGR